MRTFYYLFLVLLLCACSSKKHVTKEDVKQEVDSTGITQVATTSEVTSKDTASSQTTVTDALEIAFSDSGKVELKPDGSMLMTGVKSVKDNRKSDSQQQSSNIYTAKRDSSAHQQAAVHSKTQRKARDTLRQQPAATSISWTLAWIMLGMALAAALFFYLYIRHKQRS